jgi:flagellar basal body-associated protein FliL
MSEEFKQKTPTSRLILIIVLVVVLFALGIYIGFYMGMNSVSDKLDVVEVQTTPIVSTSATSSLTTSPIDTTNWKTYTNDKYGFSFKYPDKSDSVDNIIRITEEYSDTNDTISEFVSFYDVRNYPPDKTSLRPDETKISFNYFTNPDNLSLKDFAENELKNRESANNESYKSGTETLINGHNMYLIDNYDLFIKTDIGIIEVYSYSDDKYFDPLVSTIQFIK